MAEKKLSLASWLIEHNGHMVRIESEILFSQTKYPLKRIWLKCSCGAEELFYYM